MKQQQTVTEVLNKAKADLILLQEIKTPQIYQQEFAADFKEYKVAFNSKDDHILDIEARTETVRASNQSGTAIMTLKETLPDVNMKSIGNHRIQIMEAGEVIFMNVYLPCDGHDKLDQFLQEVMNIDTYLEENLGDKQVIIVGDFNTSKLQARRQRWQAIENLMNKYRLTYNKPSFDTNLNHNGFSTCIDFMLTTEDVKVKKITGMDRSTLPGNTSTHIPVTFDIELDMMDTDEEQPNQEEEGGTQDDREVLYERKRKVNWKNGIDLYLYRRLLRIYTEVAEATSRDMSAPWRLKHIEDMMTEAASRATIRGPRPTKKVKKSEEMKKAEITLQTGIKRMRWRRKHLLKDWHLLPYEELLQLDPDLLPDIQTLRKMDEDLAMLRQNIRNIQKKEWDKMNQDKNDEILRALENKDFSQFFQKNKISTAEIGSGINCIMHKGKKCTGNNIMWAFADHAMDQSEDPRIIPGVQLDWNYHWRRDVFLMAEFIAKHDGSELRKLTRRTLKHLMTNLKTMKSPDIYNCNLENFTNATDETIDTVVDLLNDILKDPVLFCHTSISRSWATMLYKGKGKPRDKISSYRRIQVSTMVQKILQQVIAEPAGKMTEKCKVPTQWGFSKGVSFLNATVVRETLSKMAFDKNMDIFLIATDIESAFSRTERYLQLYELATQGESGKILLISKAFYTNTDVILGEGDIFSDMFSEERGAAQGSLISPNHFKVYSVPLYRLLKGSGCGTEIAGHDWAMIAVADDAISVTDSREKFQIISGIYTQYSREYGVSFAFPKTHLNVYTKKNAETLVDGLTFGGSELKISEESEHLGLRVCQNLAKTEQVNVMYRISKTNAKIWSIMGRTWRGKYQMSLKVTKTVMQSVIAPMLSAGLSALCVRLENMKKIQAQQNSYMRTNFSTGKVAPYSPLLQILQQLPMEGEIHFQSLILFNNIFSLDTPSRGLMLHLFTDKTLRLYHWSAYIEDLLEKYDLPPPEKLAEMEPIDKLTWKRFIKPKILQYQDSILQDKIHKTGMYRFIGVSDFSISRKQLHPLLTAPRRRLEILSSKLCIKHLTMEVSTGENLLRKKLKTTAVCSFCKPDQIDTSEHLLFGCGIVQTSRAALQTKLDIFEAMSDITGLSLNQLISSYWNDQGTLTQWTLNPCSTLLPEELKVSTTDSKVNNVILTCLRHILICHAIRTKKELSREHGPPRRRAKIPRHHQDAKRSKHTTAKGKITNYFSRLGNKTTSSQVSHRRGSGSNSDLEWVPKAEDSYQQRPQMEFFSNLISICGPGVVPLLCSEYGPDGRALLVKTAIWTSHWNSSYTKGLHLVTPHIEIVSLISFIALDCLPRDEALRLAESARITLRHPDLSHDDGRLPVVLIQINHPIPVRLYRVSTSPEMETYCLLLDVAPTFPFKTVEDSHWGTLSREEKHIWEQGKFMGISKPSENVFEWATMWIDKENWVHQGLGQLAGDNQMYWRLVMLLLEHDRPGLTESIKAQAMLTHGAWDTSVTREVTMKIAGIPKTAICPMDYIARTSKSVSRSRNTSNSSMPDISPIRTWSSTPSSSARREETEALRKENKNLRKDLDEVTANVGRLQELVTTLMPDQDYLGYKTPSATQEISDSHDESGMDISRRVEFHDDHGTSPASNKRTRAEDSAVADGLNGSCQLGDTVDMEEEREVTLFNEGNKERLEITKSERRQEPTPIPSARALSSADLRRSLAEIEDNSRSRESRKDSPKPGPSRTSTSRTPSRVSPPGPTPITTPENQAPTTPLDITTGRRMTRSRLQAQRPRLMQEHVDQIRTNYHRVTEEIQGPGVCARDPRRRPRSTPGDEQKLLKKGSKEIAVITLGSSTDEDERNNNSSKNTNRLVKITINFIPYIQPIRSVSVEILERSIAEVNRSREILRDTTEAATMEDTMVLAREETQARQRDMESGKLMYRKDTIEAYDTGAHAPAPDASKENLSMEAIEARLEQINVHSEYEFQYDEEPDRAKEVEEKQGQARKPEKKPTQAKVPEEKKPIKLTTYANPEKPVDYSKRRESTREEVTSGEETDDGVVNMGDPLWNRQGSLLTPYSAMSALSKLRQFQERRRQQGRPIWPLEMVFDSEELDTQQDTATETTEKEDENTRTEEKDPDTTADVVVEPEGLRDLVIDEQSSDEDSMEKMNKILDAEDDDNGENEEQKGTINIRTSLHTINSTSNRKVGEVNIVKPTVKIMNQLDMQPDCKGFNFCKVNPTLAPTEDHVEERGHKAVNTEETLQKTGLDPATSHQNLQNPHLPHTLNPNQPQNFLSFTSFFASPLSTSHSLSILFCHNMSRAAIYCQFINYMYVYLTPSPHYSIEDRRDLVNNPSPSLGH